MLRNQVQYERQVEKLKSEVLEMKRNKVRLVQKMKEESVRHRETENQRNREVSTLKKQTRKNESKIKSLEAEKRMKELALKRKNEEVTNTYLLLFCRINFSIAAPSSHIFLSFMN